MKKLCLLLIALSLVIMPFSGCMSKSGEQPSEEQSLSESENLSSEELSEEVSEITSEEQRLSESSYPEELNPPEQIYYPSQNNDRQVVLNNSATCKIFKKVVCCGDSYTSGYIDVTPDGEEKTSETFSETNEEYSWVHYMSQMTGNNWVNCGASGANVLTWQTRDRGLPAAVRAGKAQAYVIGLMINDTARESDTVHHVDLGTTDDIGTDNPTYYGGLSKIITELNSISPKAKIFVNTCPNTDERYVPYNQAVRDVVDYYKGIYPVHCIDLVNYTDAYNNDVLTMDFINGHYTALGYEYFAELYSSILSDYINNHAQDFRDVAFIDYD